MAHSATMNTHLIGDSNSGPDSLNAYSRPEAVVRLTQKPPFPAMEGAAAWPWQYRLTARRHSIGPRSHFNAQGLRATVRDGSGDQRFALAAQQAKEIFHADNQDP